MDSLKKYNEYYLKIGITISAILLSLIAVGLIAEYGDINLPTILSAPVGAALFPVGIAASGLTFLLPVSTENFAVSVILSIILWIIPAISGYLGYRKRIISMIFSLFLGIVPIILGSLLFLIGLSQDAQGSGEGMAIFLGIIMILTAIIGVIGVLATYILFIWNLIDMRKKS